MRVLYYVLHCCILLVSSVGPDDEAGTVGVASPELSLQPHPVLPLPDGRAADRPVEPGASDGLRLPRAEPDPVPGHLTSRQSELERSGAWRPEPTCGTDPGTAGPHRHSTHRSRGTDQLGSSRCTSVLRGCSTPPDWAGRGCPRCP